MAVDCRTPCTVTALLVGYTASLFRLTNEFLYSHLLGGFVGGQAEYVRVLLGDNLKISDDVQMKKVDIAPLPQTHVVPIKLNTALYLWDVLSMHVISHIQDN